MAIDFGNNPQAPPPTALQVHQIGEVLGMITSNTEIAGSSRIINMVKISQEDYNALEDLNNVDVNLSIL